MEEGREKSVGKADREENLNLSIVTSQVKRKERENKGEMYHIMLLLLKGKVLKKLMR